jgi:hypothetical protein
MATHRTLAAAGPTLVSCLFSATASRHRSGSMVSSSSPGLYWLRVSARSARSCGWWGWRQGRASALPRSVEPGALGCASRSAQTPRPGARRLLAGRRGGDRHRRHDRAPVGPQDQGARDEVAVRRAHRIPADAKASGLRWLSLMVVVPIPWAGRRWALPVLHDVNRRPNVDRDRRRNVDHTAG